MSLSVCACGLWSDGPQRKLKTIAVKLLSTAGTGAFYTTRKNPRTVQTKMQLRKYDPVVRQHVVFQETKSYKK